MPIKTKSIRAVIVASQILLLSLIGFVLLRHSPHAKAAGTIIVTSNADTAANDGVCTLREAITAANTDTASGAAAGECAAGSGTDTINFAITGTADFTNGGQDGYIIQPTTDLPHIVEPVTIDGYSQPGAQANTAIAPNPLNGTLLIEVDLSQVTYDGNFRFNGNSDHSVLKGLSIYGTQATNTIAAITIYAPYISVQGNYIGTDASGLVSIGNCVAINRDTSTPTNYLSHDALIGGLNPADRNIVSGNSTCGSSSGGLVPSTGWVIQGNYVGVAADGLTAMPNSAVGAAGSLTIDDANDVVVGGEATGATNVISGNYAAAIAPDRTDGIVIKGNLIGTDYTGTVAVPNGAGIGISNSTNAQIGGANSAARNIIAGNPNTGLFIGSDSNITVQGNYIGTDITGTQSLGNNAGIFTTQSTDVTIGGSGAGEGNLISGNSQSGILASENTRTIIRGNKLGTNAAGTAIISNGFDNMSFTHETGDIIGGAAAGEGNLISGSDQGGIKFASNSTNITIQGNKIGTNAAGTSALANTGQGISIQDSSAVQIGGATSGARNIISGNSSNGINLSSSSNITAQGNYIGVANNGTSALANSREGVLATDSTGLIGGSSAGQGNVIANTVTGSGSGSGISLIGTSQMAILGNSIHDNSQLGIAFNGSQVGNDSLDPDSGPNNQLNYPENTFLNESAGNTTVVYSLDVPAGDYRVEFFSNTVADGSGYGEGQTYLGFDNVSSAGGGIQRYTKVLTGTTGVTNLAMTATQRNAATPSTFGATSQFSAMAAQLNDISLTKTLTNPENVATGATINYHFDFSGNGTDTDLTQFAGVFESAPLFTDYAPPELTATGYVADGPLPGTSYIDVGNPDLTCLDGGPGSAGTMMGLSVNSDYSVVICWYTGADATLPAGQTITADIGYTIANDSDLNFTNYALASASSGDPDGAAISAINGGGGDALDGFIANSQSNAPINNFAVAAYPPPPVSTIDAPPTLPEVGAAGAATIIIAAIAAAVVIKRKRQLI